MISAAKIVNSFETAKRFADFLIITFFSLFIYEYNDVVW